MPEAVACIALARVGGVLELLTNLGPKPCPQGTRDNGNVN